jgi:hypothetical protein
MSSVDFKLLLMIARVPRVSSVTCQGGRRGDPEGRKKGGEEQKREIEQRRELE